MGLKVIITCDLQVSPLCANLNEEPVEGLCIREARGRAREQGWDKWKGRWGCDTCLPLVPDFKTGPFAPR